MKPKQVCKYYKITKLKNLVIKKVKCGKNKQGAAYKMGKQPSKEPKLISTYIIRIYSLVF